MQNRLIGTFFISVLFSGAAAQTPVPVICPPVSSLSPMVGEVPSGTNPFYSKYMNADGIPILASAQVCDRSLQIVYEITLEMLSKRPDYLANLVQSGVKISIFAVNEKMTDLPEDRDLAGVWIDAAHTRKYDDTCGGGAVPGRPATVCESNLIGVQDPYYGRMSVFIHEFGHTIQNFGLDTPTANAVLAAYANAQKANLFTRADGVSTSYMMSNDMEFFAEGTGNWFNAADPTNPANSPEEQGRAFIASYAPDYYQILKSIYPDDAWVYPKH